jgi:hypothetical protein
MLALPILLMGILYQAPASAQVGGCGLSPISSHSYSFADYCGSSSITGMEGQWNNYNMGSTDPNDYAGCFFMNNEMWVYTNTSVTSPIWMEEGITNENSSTGGNGQCQGGTTGSALTVFWADGNGGFFAQHNIQNISNDGTNHVYEILSTGSNNIWYIYYDYVYQGYSSVQPSNTAVLTASGLELYDGSDGDGGRIDSDDFGNTFNNYTQAQVSYSSWFYEPWTGNYISDPCPGYNNGVCMNGVSTGAGDWNDNKP